MVVKFYANQWMDCSQWNNSDSTQKLAPKASTDTDGDTIWMGHSIWPRCPSDFTGTPQSRAPSRLCCCEGAILATATSSELSSCEWGNNVKPKLILIQGNPYDYSIPSCTSSLLAPYLQSKIPRYQNLSALWQSPLTYLPSLDQLLGSRRLNWHINRLSCQGSCLFVCQWVTGWLLNCSSHPNPKATTVGERKQCCTQNGPASQYSQNWQVMPGASKWEISRKHDVDQFPAP